VEKEEMMGINAEFNLGLLRDEYLMVQEFYQDIDRRCFTIMGWSITVAVTAIGAGIIYGAPILLLVAVFTSLMFWYVEATWRGLSHFLSVRIKQIERAIKKGKSGSFVPLQLYSSWAKEYKKAGRQTWKYLFKSLTPVPHVFIAGFSLVFYLAVTYGWLGLAVFGR
jgi:hypothetical protein